MFAAHGVLKKFLPAIAAQTAYVATSQTTTSTSYTDLTTTTDSVTVTVGLSGVVLVMMYCGLNSSTAAAAVTQYVSYEISGATTRSASDDYSILQWNFQPFFGCGFLETGLTPGSTTFKMKYRISDSSYTGTFSERRITVIPL